MTNTTFRLHISSTKDLINFVNFTHRFPESGVLNLTNETFSTRNTVKLLANFPMNDVTFIAGQLSEEESREIGSYFEAHDMMNMNPDVYPLGSIVFQA